MQQSNFLELVAKERTRQIVEKGYTIEHDDEHKDGSIADAAACYAATHDYLYAPTVVGIHNDLTVVWPFEPAYFTKNMHDRKQQLIIAAALINAEYDRIVRAEQKQNGEEDEIPQH